MFTVPILVFLKLIFTKHNSFRYDPQRYLITDTQQKSSKQEIKLEYCHTIQDSKDLTILQLRKALNIQGLTSIQEKKEKIKKGFFGKA